MGNGNGVNIKKGIGQVNNNRKFAGKWFGGKKVLITGFTLLSCIFMLNYKYWEILKLNNDMIDKKNSSKLFWTRLLFGRTRSRVTGKILEMHIPPYWRSSVFNIAIKALKINKDEIKYPIESFKSIADLFSRYIREEARPIDDVGTHSIVSPCDCVVSDFGEVNGSYIHNIKGLQFHIKEFLGEKIKKKHSEGSTKFFYVNLYLSPSMYHHFHSPSNFTCKLRRHISGETFPVFPRMLKFINNLFDINERVVLFGEWAGGNMFYVAVSAYNVGNIKIASDTELKTNKPRTQLSYLGGDVDTKFYEPNVEYNIGEEIGEFKLGSTIVLIFENSNNFKWDIKQNQKILVGQRIGRVAGENLMVMNKFITQKR